MSEEKDSRHKLEKPLELLQQLAPFIDKLARATPNESNISDQLLCAALVKCFEFSQFIFESEDDKNAFFSLATLRGICEDLISLKYFVSEIAVSDRQKILDAFLHLNLFDGLKRQTAYFKENRPLQPILRSNKLFDNIDAEVDTAKLLIQSYKQKYQWRRGYPTVEEMAQATGLNAIYDFLYAATSRTVHFTPHVLARMGWTVEPLPKDELRENIGNYEMRFSTSNFQTYYKEFCEFYSIELLVLFLQNFESEFELSDEVKRLKDKIRQTQKLYIRWPEMITFEEMNFKKPSSFMYVMANSLHYSKPRK